MDMDTTPLVYLPPPPGLNYIAAVEPCYTFVLISLPLSAILVPILFLIVFFSTPSSRRTLLFAVNVLIVLLGMVEGVLSTVLQSLIILHPQLPVSNRLFISYISLAFCTPIIVDCVLILRLSAVYPTTLTPRSTRLAILSIPLLCSAARLVCVSVFVRQWAVSGYRHTALLAGPVVWPHNNMVIADWSIQLFENLYCSALFIFRLRGHKAFSSRMYRNQTITSRLRTLFYIAVSNFVFPTCFSIVQLVYIIHDPSVIHGATVLMVNNYVSIIGVLFSTLWCCSDVKGHNIGPSYAHEVSSAFPQSIITLSGIAPGLTLGPSESLPQQSFTPSSRAHTYGHSLSRGHRPHVFADSSQSYSQADRKEAVSDPHPDAPHAPKGERDSASFLQPISLSRAVLPLKADADESEVESPARSPITPCDNEADSKAKPVRDWVEARCEYRDDVHEVGHRTISSDPGSEVDIEIDFATPTPPPADAFWQNRQRHSLSLSADAHESFDPFTFSYADSRRSVSVLEDDPHVQPSMPTPSRAQRASLLDWSDAEPDGRTRTPSRGGRSL